MRAGDLTVRRILNNWPKLVLLLVPLCVAVVSAAVLVIEQGQPETQKAMRLVKESMSRKENFTVQQYLYTTVYHRKKKGEAIEIEGWRAEQPAGPGTPVMVEFSYSDSLGRHTSIWEVEMAEKKATPRNDAASDLAWH
jgi:hypothetical protein